MPESAVSDTPKAIIEGRSAASLDEAFIAYLEDAIGQEPKRASVAAAPNSTAKVDVAGHAPRRSLPFLDLRRLLAYTQRESLELRRDPIRGTLAVLAPSFSCS